MDQLTFLTKLKFNSNICRFKKTNEIVSLENAVVEKMEMIYINRLGRTEREKILIIKVLLTKKIVIIHYPLTHIFFA